MDHPYTFTDKFNGANDAIREGVLAGLKAFAFGIQDEAVEKMMDYGLHESGQRYLIDTGAMRRSIYVQAKGLDQRDENLQQALALNPHMMIAVPATTIDLNYQVKIGVCAGYALFHEMGTVHIPARPFMGPAASALKGKAEGICAKAVTDSLRKALA